MEVPIPNFYFMGIQFIHLLALSIWVGGIVGIGLIVAPTLFRKIKSRRTAGELMGEILRKFDLLSLFCIAALIITGIIKYWTWENLTPWNLTRYLAILVMSGGGLYSTLIVSPKLRGWMAYQSAPKVAAYSREAALHPSGGLALSNAAVQVIETEENPVPDFNRLHHLSVRLMTLNLICGVIALLMA